jgi:hypothetical protein
MRAGIIDSTKFDMKGANLVPETPPTPDHNAALYPFLRLHRETSSSSPDVSKKTHENKLEQVSVDAHFYNNGVPPATDALKQRSFTQPHNLHLLMNSKNLSDSIAEHGLTASTKSVDHSDQESPPLAHYDDKAYASKFDHNGNEHYSNHTDDKHNGFLTNLIFGNKNLFNGKPLKVSAFDMTMCAPGST